MKRTASLRVACAALLLGDAAVSRAHPVTFTGSRSASNIPPGVPGLGRCGPRAAP